jgi:hypothetical protein
MDNNNERAVFVYTTYPSIVEAERAGRELVEARLCACVNILPGMVSLYWWQSAIERGEEVVMIISSARRSGPCGGEANALLYHASHSRAADRARRSGLQRLDHGRDRGAVAGAC